jgi:hypothetical protein
MSMVNLCIFLSFLLRSLQLVLLCNEGGLRIRDNASVLCVAAASRLRKVGQLDREW